MRTDSIEFNSYNKSETREPIFVVELSFDSANTDVHYLTSQPVTGLTGNIINDTLKIVSGSSQRLSPDKALSTIGELKFQCLDIGLTDLQRTKLDSGDGLRGKRVRVSVGFKNMDWADYQLITTQIIANTVTYKDKVYSFSCSDIQRELRSEIFKPKETAISASVSSTDTTINVFFTDGFERVKQPASPSGLTDAPNQKVGYIKLESDDAIEIVRYTGKTATSFTGCTRGVFGTKPVSLEFSAGDGVDEAPKVTEFVYLEMAVPKLIYAIQTGSIYGEVGEFLPDHWHRGISTDFVRTSDFVNIGSDLWDTSNNDNGLPAVIKGVEGVDAKKFIEEQLLLMSGCFMPVYATGELGLKRMSNIAPNGGYDRLLNQDNVISYGELKHDLGAVINEINVSWNYVITREDFTRQNTLVDPDSIAKHQRSKPLNLEMRTLETSRHSYTTIKSRFDSIRDRYAGPPLRLSLELMPSQNDIEVGDIVRVNLPEIADFTQSGSQLNRNFEVQQVKNDWQTGRVAVELFASSQQAGALPPEESTNIIPNSYYSSEGMEINATNFPSAVSSSGGVTTVSANITLAGTDTLGDSGGVYYCAEDLTIEAGVVVTITKNVLLKVQGFLQNNGKIDGKGNGYAGGVGVYENWDEANGTGQNRATDLITKINKWSSYNLGTKGFIDGTHSPQSGGYLSNRQFFHEKTFPQIQGSRPTAPLLNLEFDGTTIAGLPSDLQGTSGAGGGGIWTPAAGSWSSGYLPLALGHEGSDGGASGAGMAIVCRGFDHGANGSIDTSGNDSEAPVKVRHTIYANTGLPTSSTENSAAYTGCGSGGQAGAVYYILDGATSVAGNLDEDNAVAFIGDAPIIGEPYANAPVGSPQVGYQTSWNGSNSASPPASSIYTAQPKSVNLSTSAHKIQFITDYIEPDNDLSDYSSSPTFTITELTNTPVTPNGNRSTLEVSVTPPVGDESYSYSIVEYKDATKTAWIAAPPASNESLIEVQSAGQTFDVRVRPVSKSGVASPTGEVQQITVTDRFGKTSVELAALYPFAAITGLALEEGGTTFTGIEPRIVFSGDNSELAYFNFYEIEVYNGATLLRTEQSVSPFYAYSYEKNRKDHLAEEGVAGVYYDLTFEVSAVSKYRDDLGNLYKGNAASVTVTATTTNDPANLRYYSPTAANWSEVSDDDGNKPEDNANYSLPANLIDLSGWIENGAMPPAGFFETTFGDNKLVLEIGPAGKETIVWRADVQSGGFLENRGGWKYQNTGATTKDTSSYRLSFVVKHSNNTDAIKFYSSYAAELNDLDIDVAGGRGLDEVALPVADKWYLAVKVIHSKDTSLTAVAGSNVSGLYDLETGARVVNFDEHKFLSGTNRLQPALEVFSAESSATLTSTDLRLREIDGTEPSITELIVNAKTSDGVLNSSQQWADVGGADRPEDNADVTANNTAADSTNTGGLPSAVVRGGSGLGYRNGFEDGEFDDYIDGSGVTTTRTTSSHSGTYSAIITANGLDDSTSDYLSDQIPKFPIPEATIMSLAGRRCRIKAIIKQSSSSDTQYASIALIRPDSNPFGFGVFGSTDIYMPDYADWGVYTKEIEIEVTPPKGNYYIGIEPDDATGSSKGIIIDQIVFEPITASREIKFSELNETPIFAYINSDGTVANGATLGAAVLTRPSTGQYVFTFPSGYSNYPVLVTPHSSAVKSFSASYSVGQGKVTVYLEDSSGNPINSAFSILAHWIVGT